MRLLNAESQGYSPTARSVLVGLGAVIDADLDRPGLLDAVGDVDVLIVRLRNTIDDEVLAAAPRLRAVVSATTGLDHIDLEAAQRRGVEVLSLRGETDFLRTVTATAEHTWALLLALVRKLPAACQAVRAGQWDRDRFRGGELRDRRLGIVGLGRIGTMVAAYGKTFGMQVQGYDPHLYHWPATVKRYDDLIHLAADSDVLSVHVPLDEMTLGLIDRAVLTALPAGAVLINTSRGALIDEGALCELVETDRLAGVAADVVVGERNGETGRLEALATHDRRVLITPHIGGATYESMEKTEIFMANKLADHLGAQIAGVGGTTGKGQPS